MNGKRTVVWDDFEIGGAKVHIDITLDLSPDSFNVSEAAIKATLLSQLGSLRSDLEPMLRYTRRGRTRAERNQDASFPNTELRILP
jgi:hypothetical protein